MRPVKWGIISTALIGTKKVIPGMLRAAGVEVAAIASRDLARAKAVAKELGIPRAYGSYEALLADPDIEAVYNPLPNHLHVPLTVQALDAGKHVLCEKPISIDAKEAEQIVAAEKRSGKMAAEAFMVRYHPQWIRAREIAKSGKLGEVKLISIIFTYFNDDPENVRNKADIGGGGLYDIGCYAVTGARFLFDAEPERAAAVIERDPKFKTDRLTSGMLAFPGGKQLIFACATQLVPRQVVEVLGTKARLEIRVPFNAIPDVPMEILVDDGSDLMGASEKVERLPICDQYTLQAEAFSRAVRGEEKLAYGMSHAIGNMKAIDALFKAADSQKWEKI